MPFSKRGGGTEVQGGEKQTSPKEKKKREETCPSVRRRKNGVGVKLRGGEVGLLGRKKREEKGQFLRKEEKGEEVHLPQLENKEKKKERLKRRKGKKRV